MRFQPFMLEQFLSEYEQTVQFNFTESGVHPVSLGELLWLAGKEIEELGEVLLDYPEVNGKDALREQIAALYPKAHAENILVTVGASEANLLVATTFLQPQDEIIALQPTYLQFSGIAKNMGVIIKPVSLMEEQNWALDLDQLHEAISSKTRIISIVNPNNPTGSILTNDEITEIFWVAEKHDAWVLADEVYSGTERNGKEITPTLYGRYEKTLVVNSLSKAYGLPGLRCGWIAAPVQMIDELWRRHEYAVVSATMLSNHLANLALSPSVRSQLIERTRALIEEGYSLLEECLHTHPGVFSLNPPQASALSFPRFNLPISSLELCHRLRQEKEVLVVPGECFGMDHHLRITSALPLPYLQDGLSRFNELIRNLSR